MLPLLEEILQKKEVQSSAISADEGAVLQRLIAKVRPKVSLEVGLAYGVSALFICEVLAKAGGRRHIAVDPWQDAGFGGAGLRNLEEAGFGPLVDFRQKKSHVALPELLAEGVKVDFAFIDGYHTFDHVLLDFFYIDLLLTIGGVVAFDDVEWPSIHRVCRYIATNRAYRVCAEVRSNASPGLANRAVSWCARRSRVLSRLLQSRFTETDEQLGFSRSSGLIAFEKISDDTRKWDFDHAF